MALAHLKKFNIYFELQLIYGLPGETRSSFKRSLDFAVSFEPPKLGSVSAHGASRHCVVEKGKRAKSEL